MSVSPRDPHAYQKTPTHDLASLPTGKRHPTSIRPNQSNISPQENRHHAAHSPATREVNIGSPHIKVERGEPSRPSQLRMPISEARPPPHSNAANHRDQVSHKWRSRA
ncbi:hypothetical protein PtB15_17B217 [Puccinia triticina]|nr:hypothetical protein PtB15_17B217 [Puccinia triticina]